MNADLPRNRFLRALPDAIRHELLQGALHVGLPQGQILQHPDDFVPHIHFIERGLISLVVEMRDGRAVEVTARGVEGLTSPEALLDSPRAIFDAMVQLPLTAWAVDLRHIREMMQRHEPLRSLVYGYFHLSVLQLGLSAACNRLHSLKERCCRWLLTARDGWGEETFPLTHEFLAVMLGAPRSGVTQACDALRKESLIAYTRGKISIVDEAGLKDASCECYATLQSKFAELYKDMGKI